MLGNKALVVLKHLSRIMAAKMEETVSNLHGWINGRILIAVTILYSCMIWGAHLPSPLRDRYLDWGSSLGLGLMQ